jgi:hypothetical protein
MTVEPLPLHPFHDVRRQGLAPRRKPPGPLVEQGPAGELFFKVRQIGERRNHLIRRLGQHQLVERLDIVIVDNGYPLHAPTTRPPETMEL